jgi:filamentous hemagglutinin
VGADDWDFVIWVHNDYIPKKSSIWNLGSGVRGTAIEQKLGHNLPSNFPVLDKFVNGVGTSIKSMNLRAKTYSDPKMITRVGKGYINKLKSFVPKPWAGTDIKLSQLKMRKLQLVVPPNAAPGQAKALKGLKAYGRTLGIDVEIVEIA